MNKPIVGITGLLEDSAGRVRVAGSGKDTVADILIEHRNYAKISLADPMKRVCRDMFNFTDAQLWGPSEARNEPDTRYPRGYRFACGCLVPESGIRPGSAEPFIQVTDVIESCTLHDPRGLQHPGSAFLMGKFEMGDVEFLTPRLALVRLGTEWGRACYPDIWVRRCLEDISILSRDNAFTYSPTRGLVRGDLFNPLPAVPRRGYAIPDVRFTNEFDHIRAYGGVVVRVRRAINEEFKFHPRHPSEMELVGKPDREFDYVIDNNGSLQELEKRVLHVADLISERHA